MRLCTRCNCAEAAQGKGMPSHSILKHCESMLAWFYILQSGTGTSVRERRWQLARLRLRLPVQLCTRAVVGAFQTEALAGAALFGRHVLGSFEKGEGTEAKFRNRAGQKKGGLAAVSSPAPRLRRRRAPRAAARGAALSATHSCPARCGRTAGRRGRPRRRRRAPTRRRLRACGCCVKW